MNNFEEFKSITDNFLKTLEFKTEQDFDSQELYQKHIGEFKKEFETQLKGLDLDPEKAESFIFCSKVLEKIIDEKIELKEITQDLKSILELAVRYLEQAIFISGRDGNDDLLMEAKSHVKRLMMKRRELGI